jgi:hypothetical protein
MYYLDEIVFKGLTSSGEMGMKLKKSVLWSVEQNLARLEPDP